MKKGKWIFAGAMALVIGFGVSSYFSTVQAAPCRCPLIYAPVICDHGRTYPNPCVADCHNAQNCVPTGPFVQ